MSRSRYVHMLVTRMLSEITKDVVLAQFLLAKAAIFWERTKDQLLSRSCLEEARDVDTPLTRRSHRQVDPSEEWLGKLRHRILNEGLQFLGVSHL